MVTKVFQHLNDIMPSETAHQQGRKFVFLRNEDSVTDLTQFAYGKFMPGEDSQDHVHLTMEECFFILKGEGGCIINGVYNKLTPGTFLRIPAGVTHKLKADVGEVLEFVYFGIALPKYK